MKIKRRVGRSDMEFKLTPSELLDAYYEQEHRFDFEDVKCHFDAFDDEELMDSYGRSRKEVDACIDGIAYELRRLLNKYGGSPEGALYEAIDNKLV